MVSLELSGSEAMKRPDNHLLDLPSSEADLLENFEAIQRAIERLTEETLEKPVSVEKEAKRGPHGSFPLVREAIYRYESRASL